MKKPDIKKLKAEFEKQKKLNHGDPLPEYHVIEAMTGVGTDDEDYVNTWDVDFHGRNSDWCAMKLENFTCLEKWDEEDWEMATFYYEYGHPVKGSYDSVEIEPWFLDEARKILFFKKVD